MRTIIIECPDGFGMGMILRDKETMAQLPDVQFVEFNRMATCSVWTGVIQTMDLNNGKLRAKEKVYFCTK